MRWWPVTGTRHRQCMRRMSRVRPGRLVTGPRRLGRSDVADATSLLNRPLTAHFSRPATLHGHLSSVEPCNDVVMEPDDPVAAHESRELNEVVERLLERFPEMQEERVRSVVTKAHEKFVNNPIRDFVPVFVERSAREELSQSGPTAPDAV